MNVQLLKDLIEMGFSPMVALVIVGLVVLWLALCGVVVFMYRQQNAERGARDKIRDAWHAEIDARLKVSELKHEQCDKDREKLHGDVRDLRARISRFEKCPRKDCPMRLP